MINDAFVRRIFKSQSEDSNKGSLKVALDALLQYGNLEAKKKDIPVDFEPHLNRAIDSARNVFVTKTPLHRVSLAASAESLSSTSAGFSFPGKFNGEVSDEAFDIASYMQHFLKAGRYVYQPPCKIALRDHPLSPVNGPESRPVWICPMEMAILEGQWAKPFCDHLETNVPQADFGLDAIEQLAAKLLQSDTGRNDEIVTVALGFRAFDSSIPCWLIDIAFSIINDSFDNSYMKLDDSVVPCKKNAVYKYSQVWNYIKDYFKKAKIILPDGSCYRKMHGIPSGSLFNQAISSIVIYVVVTALNSYMEIPCLDSTVSGDDSTFSVPALVDTKKKFDIDASWRNAFEVFELTLKVDLVRIA